MRNTTTTIMDFYPGAYGPTIRIDVQDYKWLRLFRNAFVRLKNKEISELDLLDLGGVEKAEISGFKLIRNSYSSLSCVSSAKPGSYAAFVWNVNESDIIRIIAIIEAFISKNEAGHFYLYEEDEMLIEFAYME